MKKLIPVVFIIVAAFLAFFLIAKNLFVKDNSYSRAKIVKPVVDSDSVSDSSSENDYEDYEQTSFIELANDETLLSVVTMDIDGDGYDDQINIVKTSRSPFLGLIVGLYNPSTSAYVRATWIATNISQIRTFACTALDVIGNHKNSLVYQGITDSGHSVLCIFNGSKNKKGEFVLTKIGDFEADGTIFIQQSERNEAYELSQTKAESFPVWVYAVDADESSADSTKLDQVQTMYDWNEKEGIYTQVKQVRVKGNRIAAKELARIQDGTVATFANFLDGLWYKTDNSGKNVRYIFFDSKAQEIIFHYGDSEEVYSWLDSKLRRNGMYFTSINKSIENLQRRFDISLVNVDEIRIRIQDDVRMIISESTLWDGNYKKVTSKVAAKKTDAENENVIKSLEKGPAWQTLDGNYLIFTKDEYSVENENFTDNGRFVLNTISETQLMQFRSNTNVRFFNGYYSANFAKVKKTETDRRGRTKEFIVDDTDTIILQPVIVSPDGFFASEAQGITLKRTELKKTDE